MHRSLRSAFLFALVTLPLSAEAQTTDSRTMQFGISGGLSLPMGDVGDAYNSGFNVTGHLWFRPATLANLSFRADVAFDRFAAKDEIAFTGASLDGNFTSIGVSGNAVYSFPQSDPSAMLRPYALGGVGFYNVRSTVTTNISGVETEQESSDTNFGLQVGGGVQIQLSGFATFAEAKFVNVFSEGSSGRWIPITFGIRF